MINDCAEMVVLLDSFNLYDANKLRDISNAFLEINGQFLLTFLVLFTPSRIRSFPVQWRGHRSRVLCYSP